MRVLSVRQPWASLIESGRKPIELRSWFTKYRGPVLIVSGSRPWSGKTSWPKDGPLGVSICIVDLVDVRPAVAKDAHAACIEVPTDREYYAWVFANPRPVKRVKVKGRLGLYEPEAKLRAAIAA